MSAPSAADLGRHLVTTANARPATAEMLGKMILDRVRYDAAGRPTVLDLAGSPMVGPSGELVTPAALVGQFAKEMPHLFWEVPPRPGSIPPRPQNASERSAADHRPAAGDQPNPFSKKTWNLTQQVLLKKRDPTRAAQLEAAAGV